MEPTDNPFASPEATDLATTPRGGLVLASRRRRFFGAMIDQAFYMVPIAAGAIVESTVALEPIAVSWLSDGYDVILLWEAMIGFAGLLIAASLNWYLVSTTGQSIGKWVVGTRIAVRGGLAPGFFSGVVQRSWVIGAAQALPILLGYERIAVGIGLVNALVIFSKDHRCIHDHLAGTNVVYANRFR